jgi:hypothetical protein
VINPNPDKDSLLNRGKTGITTVIISRDTLTPTEETMFKIEQRVLNEKRGSTATKASTGTLAGSADVDGPVAAENLSPDQVARQSGKKSMPKISEFMDDLSEKGNAISRSFRSSGGRGLAGFIESMSFDWYDRVTWEISHGTGGNDAPVEGRRAPKVCKVSIGFSPIHDITPGLDHTGFNRAPIYPVGPMHPVYPTKKKE